MLAGLLLMPVAGATGTQQRRPLQVDDIFEMEGIGHAYGGPFAFSADGKSLAFTRLRARKTLLNHQREFLLSNDRADVWMQLASGEPVTNLTQGERNASGWWAPQWSADGQWLAMLSTRDGRVTLWGWRKASKQLIQLSEREVELQDYDRPPFVWLSNSQILLPVASEQPTRAVIESDLEATPRLAGAAWRDAAIGERPTVSALYSGKLSSSPQRAQGQLLLIDIKRQQAKVLANRSTAAWTTAPDGRAVAFARNEGVYVPSPDEPLPLRRITPTAALATWSVSIHSSDGAVLVESAGVTQDVLPESIRWSP
ncbi:MAG: PD40 domain-containing protein, partial [Steroidobacter sp.]|nr:PD40 domain-containing protein [Steroidobacter sp.]